jgi:circadian clock protein KaiC
MHELLNYLNQLGVITFMIMGQHGFIGDMRSEVDLSYLERTIREFKLSSKGLQVGESLQGFEGVMTGLPSYRGETPLINPGL